MEKDIDLTAEARMTENQVIELVESNYMPTGLDRYIGIGKLKEKIIWSVWYAHFLKMVYH
jgi:hypothetical protein